MKISARIPVELKIKKLGSNELAEVKLAANESMEVASLVAWRVRKGSTWTRPAGLSGDLEFRPADGGVTTLCPSTPLTVESAETAKATPPSIT
jgi:hypothetical protein